MNDQLIVNPSWALAARLFCDFYVTGAHSLVNYMTHDTGQFVDGFQKTISTFSRTKEQTLQSSPVA